MLYRALVSFTGIVTMRKDEVRDLTDIELIKDLLNAKYIEEVKGAKEEPVKKKNSKRKE